VRRSRRLVFAILMTYACAIHAADDAVLEKRVAQVAAQLRCLVCQNQTIADSNAALAVDLKQQVREQLTHGATEKEVLGYMVRRYGDFVLYDPPLKRTTWLLWFGPFLLLLSGLGFLIMQLRRRQAGTGDEQ
jgi:cytochrome c-type biogenesis protein CcmH